VPVPLDLVCRCFFVTESEITELVTEKNFTSIGEVTEACSAGGGCGSCRPDIAQIISTITGKEVDPFSD